ncbi:MAG: chromate transporter [bacterium]|nr:chromate transporter [bacterium]
MENRKADKKKLLTLFISTLYISAFTFGGGFVIITLMKKKFADELHWIEEDEMLDLAAIAQSSPGAIAVNAAILVGYRVAGSVGMLISILGTILPPMVILSIVSIFYTAFRENYAVALLLAGMQAGVAAVILDVVYTLGKNVWKEKSILAVAIMLGAFVAVRFLGINIIYIILIAAFIGAAKTMILMRKERGEGKRK